MTPHPLSLAGFALFLLAVTTYAAARSGSMLTTVSAISLICAQLLSRLSMVLFGHIASMGAIFFAVSVYGISLKYLGYGAREAYRTIGEVATALVFVLGVIFCLQDVGLLEPGVPARIQIAGARLTALLLVAPLFVRLLAGRSTWPAYGRVPVITACVLTVDALVFIPWAYSGTLPDRQVIDAIAGSIGLRLATVAASLPFLAVFLWLQDRGLIAQPGRDDAIEAKRA